MSGWFNTWLVEIPLVKLWSHTGWGIAMKWETYPRWSVGLGNYYLKQRYISYYVFEPMLVNILDIDLWVHKPPVWWDTNSRWIVLVKYEVRNFDNRTDQQNTNPLLPQQIAELATCLHSGLAYQLNNSFSEPWPFRRCDAFLGTLGWFGWWELRVGIQDWFSDRVV